MKDINAGRGIFAGDIYIREKAEHIKKISGEKGRISGGRFLIIRSPDGYNADKVLFGSGAYDDLEVKVIIPQDTDRIEEIFQKGEGNDRKTADL